MRLHPSSPNFVRGVTPGNNDNHRNDYSVHYEIDKSLQINPTSNIRVNAN